MENKLDLIKIEDRNGVVVTTSLNVAEIFSKEHKRVLQDIRDIMEKWDEIDGHGFEPVKKDEYFIDSSYVDAKGESRKMFLLTKKGAARLIMGYTGLDAERYKVEYIERFEAMEKLINDAKNIINKQQDRTPLDLAANDIAAWMKIADLCKAPHHIAIVEGAKQVKKDYQVDISGLIKQSNINDNINEEDIMLEPTELGIFVGLGDNKGRQINNFLREAGFQVKVNGEWIPTSAGEPFCFKHYWNNNHGTKTGYNLKWKRNWFIDIYNKKT